MQRLLFRIMLVLRTKQAQLFLKSVTCWSLWDRILNYGFSSRRGKKEAGGSISLEGTVSFTPHHCYQTSSMVTCPWPESSWGRTESCLSCPGALTSPSYWGPLGSVPGMTGTVPSLNWLCAPSFCDALPDQSLAEDGGWQGSSLCWSTPGHPEEDHHHHSINTTWTCSFIYFFICSQAWTSMVTSFRWPCQTERDNSEALDSLLFSLSPRLRRRPGVGGPGREYDVCVWEKKVLQGWTTPMNICNDTNTVVESRVRSYNQEAR